MLDGLSCQESIASELDVANIKPTKNPDGVFIKWGPEPKICSFLRLKRFEFELFDVLTSFGRKIKLVVTLIRRIIYVLNTHNFEKNF